MMGVLKSLPWDPFVYLPQPGDWIPEGRGCWEALAAGCRLYKGTNCKFVLHLVETTESRNGVGCMGSNHCRAWGQGLCGQAFPRCRVWCSWSGVPGQCARQRGCTDAHRCSANLARSSGGGWDAECRWPAHASGVRRIPDPACSLDMRCAGKLHALTSHLSGTYEWQKAWSELLCRSGCRHPEIPDKSP